MKYNFDEIIDRSNTYSFKRDCLPEGAPKEMCIRDRARAPGLGPGGRRFESCHPDLYKRIDI